MQVRGVSLPLLLAYSKVAAGDSLPAIAAANGVSPEELAAANGIAPDTPLRVGQILIIRIPAGPTPPPARPATAERPAPHAAPGAGGGRAAPGSGSVYLAIDQSFGTRNLPAVVRLLDAHGAKANWFLTGKWAARNPAAARALATRGDLVGNHTWSHRNLRELPLRQAREEITRGRDAIAAATGIRTSWLRPPFGQSTRQVESAARDAGHRIVDCTVDSLDWQSFGPPASLEHILRSGLDGAVISLHAGADRAPAVLEALLGEIARRGYRTARLEAPSER